MFVVEMGEIAGLEMREGSFVWTGKWDFPYSFFLFDIQSMRRTACVKAQII